VHPGDFSQREDEKSFTVHPSEGLMLLLQSTLGPPGRDAAALATQLQLSPGGVSHVWILSDGRAPGLQAVLQPGPEGSKLLKLGLSGRPGAAPPGVSLEGDVTLAFGGLHAAKCTAKLAAPDFLATLAVSPLGAGPPSAELTYHQSLGPTGFTAGGTLSAAFAALLPAPAPARLAWGAFGSWTEPRRRDRAVYARFGAQQRADGADALGLSVQTWRRVAKGLELGANASATLAGGGGPAWLPLPLPAGLLDTAAGAGARYTFEGPGGLNPVLVAHLSTAGVASLSWQKPTASGVTNTFMRTTLSAVLDHPRRDYKYGATVEFFY